MKDEIIGADLKIEKMLFQAVDESLLKALLTDGLTSKGLTKLQKVIGSCDSGGTS